MSEQPKTIDYPVWWKPGGGMMYRRDALPPDHPEAPYGYIQREYGLDPEDYGIKNPINIVECPICKHKF